MFSALDSQVEAWKKEEWWMEEETKNINMIRQLMMMMMMMKMMMVMILEGVKEHQNDPELVQFILQEEMAG